MTAPKTHDEAVDLVLLAMLTTAATINRPATLRALDAVAQFLRALECDVCAPDDEKDPEIAANASRTLYYAACQPGGIAADPELLGCDSLARAVASMLLPMSADCGDALTEMYEPGELEAEAVRVEAMRAMFATVGGVA